MSVSYYSFLQAAVQSPGTMQQEIVFPTMLESPLGTPKTAPSDALGSKAALLGHSPLKLIIRKIASSIFCILGL